MNNESNNNNNKNDGVGRDDVDIFVRMERKVEIWGGCFLSLFSCFL